MTTFRVSEDRRTTKDNPVFVGFVALGLAARLRRRGDAEGADRLSNAGAMIAERYGVMARDVEVPESDLEAVGAYVLQRFGLVLAIESAVDGTTEH